MPKVEEGGRIEIVFVPTCACRFSDVRGVPRDRDVLIMPAGTSTAERHDEETSGPEEYPFALSAVSGCLMVVIPAGVEQQGLPFGLQIIGKRWDDERLLDIAESVWQLTGGFRRPPGY